jgi:hypothetical protein
MFSMGKNFLPRTTVVIGFLTQHIIMLSKEQSVDTAGNQIPAYSSELLCLIILC